MSGKDKTSRLISLAFLVFATLLLLLISIVQIPATAEADEIYSLMLVDRLEYQTNEGDDTLLWDAQGWLGGDYNKLWVKTQGEKVFDGDLEEAELQVLYSRAITAFWDIQVGVRQDFKPDPSRTFGVIGLQGLSPYKFEVDAAAFISEDGDISARVEGEYDVLITQRLIAQPRAELNLTVQDVEKLGIGSGLTDVELGLRLRYEIRREFAPYIGVSWNRKVGETADLARDAGEDVGALSFVVGVRMWF